MLFSLIMPVYNAEPFIEKSIQSVLNQTYREWELIIINDGSTDNSIEIINQYCERDSRVRCISIPNGGVSSARNRGLQEVQGDFVLFVDSDDEIDAKMLSIINGTVNTYSCDVVSFNAYKSNTNSVVIGTATKPLSDDVLVVRGEDEKKKYIYSSLTSSETFGIACNFAAKYDLVRDLKFRTDMILCEDLLFDMQMYQIAETVVCLPDYLYYYRCNPSGCTNNFNYKKIENLRIAYEAKLNMISAYGLDYNRNAALYFFCASIIQFCNSTIENRRLYKQYVKNIRNDEYIVARFEERKENHTDTKQLSTQILFGNAFVREFLRIKMLVKRKIKKLLIRLKLKKS